MPKKQRFPKNGNPFPKMGKNGSILKMFFPFLCEI
jgi:hypothetical protein